MVESKKGGGGKLNKTQTVTLRLDPKLRYLTDLAARTQRRTTSGFIEWAVEKALDSVVLTEYMGQVTTISDEASSLWDIDEADRFVMLAFKHPNLLTHDEQVLWKFIKENPVFWGKKYKNNPMKPQISKDSMDFKTLRKYWQELKLLSEGKIDSSAIPTERKNL